MRHEAAADEPVVRSYAVTHPPGTVVVPQPPGWDQLVYASSGAMRVVTPDGIRVVPPDRALWVPDGVVHRIELGAGRTSLRTLYLIAGLASVAPAPHTIEVGPLLRELVLHAVATAPLWRTDARHDRLIGVLIDQLVVRPERPAPLPFPSDARARAVADALLTSAGGSDDLGAVAAGAGASRRTIERRFREETGLTVGRWRTRARMLEAVRLLADGEPVARVAATVGYATPSAFTAAFRAELGVTPNRVARRGGAAYPLGEGEP